MTAGPPRLGGRRAVVTGASRGIGAAVAERLGAEGAAVAVVARTREHHPTLGGSLDETAARIRGHGSSAAVIVADLSDPADRSRIVPEAQEALGGPVDILVNNAAAGIFQPLAEVPLRRFRLAFEVNVTAPLDLAQAVVPAMREAGEGWIVNLTSGAARPTEGPPYQLAGIVAISGVYGATKAALNRMTNALAAELWGTGIRVNTVEPRSTILTEGTTAFLDATPGGLGMEPPGGQFEAMEPVVEATVALCRCPESCSGGTHVSLDLVSEWGLEVQGIDGRSLTSGH